MIKKWLVNLLLMVLLPLSMVTAQVSNDGCDSATPLCPNVSISGSNIGATATLCPNCEDDYSFCFTGSNTVWYSFTTNSNGGNVTMSFNNLVFNNQVNRGTELQAIMVQAAFPCDGSTYTAVSNCEVGSAVNFSITATALTPNTVYYLIVNGAKNAGATLPAEADFDLIGSGPGFDRLPTNLGIGGPSGIVCPETPVAFTAYLSNCTDTSQFTWYINNTIVAVTNTSLWFTSSLQDGDLIEVECSCFNVCPDTLRSAYGPITVDQLVVDAGPDQTIELGQSTIITGTTNGTIFNWTPGNTLTQPNLLSTVAVPEETTTYYLTVSDTLCYLTDEMTVFVSDNLVIPGSFSPNNDGVNDKWIIKGIEFFPNAEMTIYDRWGQEIEIIVGYSITKAWTGTKKGNPISDGVYFYTLDLNSPKYDKPLKGSITIIK